MKILVAIIAISLPSLAILNANKTFSLRFRFSPYHGGLDIPELLGDIFLPVFALREERAGDLGKQKYKNMHSICLEMGKAVSFLDLQCRPPPLRLTQLQVTFRQAEVKLRRVERGL